MKLSVCIITKDEEQNIFRCLKSIKKIADEIIIVDSGSLDNTLEIARNFKCKIINISWCDDFSYARNISLAAASGEWILVIDADEELTKNSAEKIKDILNETRAEGYYVQINSYVEDGYVIRHKAVRLFRNRKEYSYTGKVYEDILPSIIKNKQNSICPSSQEFNHFGYHQEGIEKKLLRNIRILKLELAEESLNPKILANLGNSYYLLKDFKTAIDYYEKTLRNDNAQSYLPVVIRNLALVYLQDTNYEKCEEILQKALDRYRDYTDLYFLYGNLLSETGRFEKSLFYYQKCLEMGETDKYPSILGVGSYYPLLGTGKSLEKLGRLADSLQVYIKSLSYKEIRNKVIDLAVPLASFTKSNILDQIFQYDFTVQEYLALADGYAYWGNYSGCLDILNNFTVNDFVRFFRSYCLLHNNHFSQALEELLHINIINNPRLILNSIFLCACGLNDDLLIVNSGESLKLFLEPSAAQVYADLLTGCFKGAENTAIYLNQCWILLKEFIEMGLLDWVERIIDFAFCINKLETLCAVIIFFWKNDSPLVWKYMEQLNNTAWPIFNIVKGDLMLQMGRYQEARASFQGAEEEFPEDELVNCGLNLIKYKQLCDEYPQYLPENKELVSTLEAKYNYAAFRKKNQLSYLLLHEKEEVINHSLPGYKSKKEKKDGAI